MIGDRRHPVRNDFPSASLKHKFSVGTPGTYILNSSTASEGQVKIAASLSNNYVNVYDIHGHLLDSYVHELKVTDLKYSAKEPSCLFTSSVDGKIRIFDSRCQGLVQTFVDESDEQPKALLCFDMNDEDLLCAGTESIREDTFLLFWDRRTSDILGGYWNSHTNDMTQVLFSSETCLASASLDGLINIFNLTEHNEDDALMHTLNTGSGVNMLNWHDWGDLLSCITCLEEYQIWAISGASPISEVTKKSMPEPEVQINVDFMIDSIVTNKSRCGKYWYLATGMNNGIVNLWHTDHTKVYPSGYTLKGHYDTVRTIDYNLKDDYIVTGGEDSHICIWMITT